MVSVHRRGLDVSGSSHVSIGKSHDRRRNATGEGRRRRGRRPGRTRLSQCDAMLLGQLDPNRPDIAAHVGKHALKSSSQSEAGWYIGGEVDPLERQSNNFMRSEVNASPHVSLDRIDMVRQGSEAPRIQNLELPPRALHINLATNTVQDDGWNWGSPSNTEKEKIIEVEALILKYTTSLNATDLIATRP